MSQNTPQPDVFRPSEKALARAIVTDFDALRAQAIADPSAFWDAQARQLQWFKTWDEVVEWQPDPPHVEWFLGARCNITVNALDRHVENGKRNKVAFIWAAEEGDAKFKERKITYGELLRRVNQTANALKSLGVKQGDRVTLYMALTPELPIAMLACARIGAIHCVVYAGFSAPALKQRIEDSESRVVICSDIGYRRGKRVDLKGIVDEATRGLELVEKIMVYRRGHTPLELNEPRELDWDETLDAQSETCEPAVLSSEAPLFYLYTSGTTGKPKGIVHVHGGYMVGTSYTHRIAFDVNDDDIFFCTRRSGLDYRALLRRLRPLNQWRDGFAGRRRVGLPRRRALVGFDPKIRRQHFLFDADRDSRVDALRRRISCALRFEFAARFGQRRRADQPRSVAVASSSRRP